MNKTVGMYILELDSDIIQKFCKNIKRKYVIDSQTVESIKPILDYEVNNGYCAISNFIDFKDSPEGAEFWYEVAKYLKNKYENNI